MYFLLPHRKVLRFFAAISMFVGLVLVLFVFERTDVTTSQEACLTIDQIQTDSRCLYILDNYVYERGSRNSPHKDHACGIDVGSIIPDKHRSNASKYLGSGEQVAPLCSGNVPTVTPMPPTATPGPTSTPIPQPTYPPSVYDYNADGLVNSLDYGIIQQAIGSVSGSPFYNSNYDFNHDNVVNGDDMAVFLQHWQL